MPLPVLLVAQASSIRFGLHRERAAPVHKLFDRLALQAQVAALNGVCVRAVCFDGGEKVRFDDYF